MVTRQEIDGFLAERSLALVGTRVWFQQGAESEAAIEYCRDHGMSAVHGQCILMYPKPATSWIHGAHRWVSDALGRTPK